MLANAGIGVMDATENRRPFRDQLDVNLVGVWNTVQAAAPLMIEQGRGGAIVLTSSAFGLTGRGGDGSGDGRLRREQARGRRPDAHLRHWLAPHGIRVNSTDRCATPMVLNPAVEALFGGGDDPAPDPKPVDDVTNLFDVPSWRCRT